MTELFILTVAGAGAWAMRASAIVLVGNRPVPEAAVRALGYAKHAVLAALVGAALTSSGNGSALWLVTPQGVAAVAAGAVAWRTRGILRTLLAGVGTAAFLAEAWPL